MHPFSIPRFSFALLVLPLVLFTLCLTGETPDEKGIDIVKCWSYSELSAPPISVAIGSSHVFVGMAGGKLDGLNRAGRKLWSSDLGGSIASELLTADGTVFVVTTVGGSNGARQNEAVLRSLSGETGVTLWSRRLIASGKHFLRLYQKWVIAASLSGSVEVIEIASGDPVWKVNLPDGLSAPPVLASERLLVPSLFNVFSIEMSSGKIDRPWKHSYGLTAIAGSPSGGVLAGDERGNIVSFSTTNDKTGWTFKSGGEISKLLLVGPTILAASYDNYIYALSAQTGSVGWKRRLAGKASDLLRIGDRFALISSVMDGGVAIVYLENGRVAGRIPFQLNDPLQLGPIIRDGIIVVTTNKAVSGYSIGRCDENREGGAAVTAAPPS